MSIVLSQLRAIPRRTFLLGLLVTMGCSAGVSDSQPTQFQSTDAAAAAASIPDIFDSTAQLEAYLPAPGNGSPVATPSAAPQPGDPSTLPPNGMTRDSILKIQASPPGAQGFTFVYLGDSRDSSPFSSDGDTIYRHVIDVVNQQGGRFAIHGGDFTFDNMQGH